MCKTDDAKLFAARPGCRLWLSDIQGTVKSTHVFSDPLSPAVKEIPLLMAGKLYMSPSDFQLGLLKRFRDRELVSWSGSALVVLDPWDNRVVARQSRLSGIEGVAVVDNEIFLLRRHAEARVIRISDGPDSSAAKAEILRAPHSTLHEPAVNERSGQTEKKENIAKSFFRKTFTNPIKRLDDLLSDDKTEEVKEAIPKPVIEAVSPDLPPVVTLASSELEGIRVFTGTLPSEAGAVPTATALSISGSAENEVKATTEEDDAPSALSSLMSATSALAVVSNTATDPKAFDPNSASQSTDSRTSSQHSETSVASSAPETAVPSTSNQDDIVFSHRMKKPKKKKHKGGTSNTRQKDEDAVSQTSVNSQHSDDSGLTAAKAYDSQTSNSSSLEALKRADEMLKLVDTILKEESVDSTGKKESECSEDTLNDNVVTATQRSDHVINSYSKVNSGSGLKDQRKDKPNNLDLNQAEVGIFGSKKDDLAASGEKGRGFSCMMSSDKSESVFKSELVDTDSSADIKSVVSSNKDGTRDREGTELLQADMNMDRSLTESDQSLMLRATGQSDGQKTQESEKGKNSTEIPLQIPCASTSASCDGDGSEVADIYTYSSDISPKNRLIRDSSFDIINSALVQLDSRKAEVRTPDSSLSMYATGHSSDAPEQKKLTKVQRVFEQSDSFQDIYSSVSAIEAEDPFNKGMPREKSADDFYSKFIDTSPESSSYMTSPDANTPGAAQASKSLLSTEVERSSEMQDVCQRRVANSWSEFTTPTNMYSLAVSQSHVWFTDKSENIYYSSVGSPKGIVWRKASGSANQIAVSPSGHIVWRLHRGVVFAGTKISSRHPEGLKWVEAVRDVEWISVDDNCAWYIKRSGEVMMQRNLSLERPCYKSRNIQCEHKLRSIQCANGVVWAITEGLRLLVRTGVSDELPEGSDWLLDFRETAPYLFSSVAVDSENIGWAIDVLGQIWFCNGVTRQNPAGAGQWWQVPMSEYILQEASTLDMIRAMARKFDPKQLSYILSTNRGGLITAGTQGVWLALDFRNVLQVCRGSIQGYHWLEAHPAQMSPSSTWKMICANVAEVDWGLVWAQQTNGDIYVFRQPRGEAAMIPDCYDFCCFSVSMCAVWALTPDGEIMVRAGMNERCPQGSSWVNLDLSQLGDAHIIHLSCNTLYVWAVESEGVIYQRIGAKPPSDNTLSAVWLPIDTFADIVFTRVNVGPLDWMVWAVDNRRLTYVRVGITEHLPIGQEWIHVPGIQAMDLSLTRSGIWALTPTGEVYFRYGVSRERPAGNYWKKIPGTFIKISASPSDDLWAINTEGHLMHCSTQYLLRSQDVSDPLLQRSISTSSSVSEDVDWEIV
ncbi:tectonin beta-propeller repeat-containing protein 2 isoform X2 [Aplysia californica]|nr:tectonin beta-propeller repeat-containing protein 2 isoform X2 [Aplysia californica]